MIPTATTPCSLSPRLAATIARHPRSPREQTALDCRNRFADAIEAYARECFPGELIRVTPGHFQRGNLHIFVFCPLDANGLMVELMPCREGDTDLVTYRATSTSSVLRIVAEIVERERREQPARKRGQCVARVLRLFCRRAPEGSA